MNTEHEGYKINHSNIQVGQRIRVVKDSVGMETTYTGVVHEVLHRETYFPVAYFNHSQFSSDSVQVNPRDDVYLLSHRAEGEPKEPLTQVTWVSPPGDGEGIEAALFIAVKTSWDYWEVMEFNTSEYTAGSTEKTWGEMCAMIAGNAYTINEAPEVLRKKEEE